MKTFTTLKNLATNLSNNASSANDALMGQLINDRHRYLLQRFFDNERSAQFTTVGPQTLTLTVAPAVNDVSATLSAVWSYPTCQQLVNFSSGEQRLAQFTNNSASITWTGGLLDVATTTLTTVGVQEYSMPADISKIVNDTISIGQLKFVPAPVQSRAEWDQINFLPYVSDIPNYYYIYNHKLCIFPIPSTTGNIGTYNYKARVPDLTFADYSTGTINTGGMVVGGTTVTGLATNWSSSAKYPTGIDISYYNLCLRADPPYGDGIWYPIRQVVSDTSLILANPVLNAPNITNQTTYTIGQIPLLSEDFHDMLVYGALQIYYSSIVQDANKFKEYQALYTERLSLLESYAGTKSNSVDLGVQPSQVNPNLFLYGN